MLQYLEKSPIFKSMEKDFKSPVSTIPPRGQLVDNACKSQGQSRTPEPPRRPFRTRETGTAGQIWAQSGKALPESTLQPKFQQLFWSRVNRTESCWEWSSSKDAKGYGRIRLPGRRAHFRAHRIAFFLSTGVDPRDLLVCHTCDNPSCVRPDHLFLGTIADNVSDMMAKGRNTPTGISGAQNPSAVLSESDVRAIVALILGGKTNTEIAKQYGVSGAMISCIRLGKAWRVLTESMGYEPKPSFRAPKSGRTGVKKW